MSIDFEGMSTQQLLMSINVLRERGFAIVVFNPTELAGIEDFTDRLESALVQDGNDHIEVYQMMSGLGNEDQDEY